jgi:hypothetical protein
MWQDHDRWRQRFRVVIFVLAVSALITAWWSHATDSFSVPTVLIPIDGWLGITPQGHARPPLSNAATPPATPPSGSSHSGPAKGTPGTIGTAGGSGAVSGSLNRGPSPDGSVTRVTFGPKSVIEREPPKRRTTKDADAIRDTPCEPRHDDQTTSTDTQPTREGTHPCDAGESPERHSNGSDVAAR